MRPDLPRICMLVEPFYPVSLGGAELQALHLARGLAARGLPVTVVTRRERPGLLPHEVYEGIAIYRLPPGGRHSHLTNLVEVLPITRFLLAHRHDYDVLHVHNVRGLFICGVLTHWLTGKPLIVKPLSRSDATRQKLDAATRTNLSLYSKVLRRFILPDPLWRWLLRRASAWVAVSREICDDLYALGLGDITHYIPNGVDLTRFRPAAPVERQHLRSALDLPVDRTLLISHGRITPSKRLDVLIEAIGALYTVYPGLLMLLPGPIHPGDEPFRDDLERLVQANGLEEVVRFLGPIEQIEDYLRASDIFVLSSEREGLPNALIEAMACGLPVVATEIGGVTDLIVHGESGLLVPAGDASALEEGIMRHLSQPEHARRMASAAEATVRKRLAWPQIVTRYASLYAELLEQGR